MATWSTITQTGSGQWWVAGGNITNHEVFAFTLQGAEHNVGALISDVTVFLDQDNAPNQTSYILNLNAVDNSLNPVDLGITGNFESNGV